MQSTANKRLASFNGVSRFSELGLAHRVAFEAAGGVAAGVVLPVFFTPIELVKVQQQTRQAARQLSSWRILRDVVRHEGAKGLYAGHAFTVWRSVIGNAFLFGPYELAKDLTGRVAGDDPRAQGAARLVAGVLAGWCSWLSFFPVSRDRTRPHARAHRHSGRMP